MATNIAGLFGNTTKSDYEYRQDAISGMLVSPGQMAQLPLLQQVAAMGTNAGASIGSGVAQLLGGKTASQVRDSNINEALQSVQEAGIEGEYNQLAALSEKLSGMGMNAEAQKAMDSAREIQLQELRVQKAQKDLEQPQYQDVYSIYKDEMGNQKQGRVTMKWNSTTEEYEHFGGNTAVGGGAGGNGDPDVNRIQEEDDKRKADAVALKEREAAQTQRVTGSTEAVRERVPANIQLSPEQLQAQAAQERDMIARRNYANQNSGSFGGR